MNQRLDKLLASLEQRGLGAFLVSKPENIRYLSGFSGGSDARLLILKGQGYILTDSRYFQQAASECPGWELVEEKPGSLEQLARICSHTGILGVEGAALSYTDYRHIEQALPGVIMPVNNIVEDLRLVKDQDELEHLRQAARIGDQVFALLINKLQIGMTERQAAAEIAYQLRLQGCDRESFDTIAVAGENAALPHGHPGDRALVSGDMLTLDFGGFYQAYAGDMTRTIGFGKISKLFCQRYACLLEAQLLGVSLVRAGAKCQEIDQAVREYLGKHDLASYFIHGTGHGVGLEVHEQPRVSSRSEEVLAENMVVTIEPGIYFPGWGGIRIEDTVIVKEGGCEIITLAHKELIII
ncbi:M24 family metallopeptidase [Syntrophomonas palmitatica]|uniref:M24 family metallopeptidase n=1 Tax=Syntrophomonas palmitatica TaxID=402877 RepID=UPI0006D1D684|nr:Xaa-Pro peptidase family protein [Syntrophomonas palmitatica]